MTTTAFTIIVIAVPIVVLAAAIGLSRFSDRLYDPARPKVWFASAFGLGIIYCVIAIAALTSGNVWRAILHFTVALAWTIAGWSTLRRSSRRPPSD